MIDEKQLQEWRKLADAIVYDGETMRGDNSVNIYDFIERSKTAMNTLLNEVARLNARVAHLEGLLSDIDKMQIDCPFCKATIIDSHSDTCRAFTPGGDVK